jgi:ribosome biogenesis GTPase
MSIEGKKTDDKNELMHTGQVLAGYGSSYPVKYRDRVYQCTLRGRFRQVQTEAHNPVAVGDWVRFQVVSGVTGVIEEILLRRNKLSRPTKEGAIRERVIAANVDQVVAVVSVQEPPLKTGAIDRMLLTVEREAVRGIVCINKIDLDSEGIAPTVAEVYRKLRYTVLMMSAKTGEGIDTFGRVLRGKFSVLIGQSGVGKSSLLNFLIPGLNQQVKEISAWCGKGKHVTSFVLAVPYGFSGLIADTPGFRDFGLWGIDKRDLGNLFREFRRYSFRCKFQPCFHISEPGCAVKDAYQAGKIARSRYENYVRIYESLEGKGRVKYGG